MLSLKKIFHHQTSRIGTAAIIISLSTLLSRLLGFLRDGLLMARFGAGRELDMYFAAFRIPDLVYGILITGGVIAVFIPLFSEKFKKGKEEAFDFANNLLNVFLFLLVIISFILSLFTPYFLKLIAPGFSPEEFQETVLLTRILFLSPIIFGLSSIFSGMLQYFGMFLAYSLAPVLYNLGIIFGILFLAPHFGVLGLVIGVIVGALSHLLVQVPSALKSGFRYKFIFNIREKFIKKAFRLMIPRSLGTATYHINLIFMTALASLLGPGSITVFNLANNLQYFPVGIVGVSFAIASFPSFSKSWASEEKEKFFSDITSTTRKILFVVIPLSVIFLVLRFQIVQLLNLSGKFILGKTLYSFQSIELTSLSLGLFSFGIFALSLSPLFSRIFFSFQDTKTPLISSILAISLNVSLAIFFIYFFGLYSLGEEMKILALPLSCSIAEIFRSVFLFFFLEKKFSLFGEKDTIYWQREKKEIKNFLKDLFIVSLIFGIIVWLSLKITNPFVNKFSFWSLFFQSLLAVSVGGVILLFFSRKLKIKEEKYLTQLLGRFLFNLKRGGKSLK